MNQQQIDVGYGYRRLAVGEQIREGDEFWMDHSRVWETTGDPGIEAPHDLTYRRKIEPGAGYRLLKRNDKLEPGDEILMGTEPPRWEEYPVFASSDDRVESGIFRRLVEPAKSKPTIGAGYRELRVGEKIMRGDEVWESSKHGWFKSSRVGGLVEADDFPKYDLVYRRPVIEPVNQAIDPGVGYRLLNDREIVRKSDEYLSGSASAWLPVGVSAGKTVSSRISSCRIAFRRRIAAPAVPVELVKPGLALNSDQAERLKRLLDWLVEHRMPGCRNSAKTLVTELFPPTQPPPKKYRLLSVGEIRKEGDEYYTAQQWYPVRTNSVVESSDIPCRREVSEFVGGPA